MFNVLYNKIIIQYNNNNNKKYDACLSDGSSAAATAADYDRQNGGWHFNGIIIDKNTEHRIIKYCIDIPTT